MSTFHIISIISKKFVFQLLYGSFDFHTKAGNMIDEDDGVMVDWWSWPWIPLEFRVQILLSLPSCQFSPQQMVQAEILPLHESSQNSVLTSLPKGSCCTEADFLLLFLCCPDDVEQSVSLSSQPRCSVSFFWSSLPVSWSLIKTYVENAFCRISCRTHMPDLC